MATTPSIVCKDCSHVNEAQRIYCHNCGVKLDRTAIQQAQKGGESNEQKHKRVKKILSPSGGGLFSKKSIGSLIRSVFWGGVAALIITLVRPPADIPEPAGTAIPEPPPIGLYLQEQATPSIQRVLSLKEDDINEYLRSVLRPKDSGAGGGLPVKFQRAFVNLTNGQVRVTSQTGIGGFSFYTGVSLQAGSQKGAPTARPVALHFGRLTIPEFITQHLVAPMNIFFGPLKEALKEERKSLEGVGALEIRDGVVLIASPNVAIPPAKP